jgi:hypothetical protein
MLLYAAADLHGKGRHFRIIVNHIRQNRVDAVVLAGDLLNYGRGHHYLSLLDDLPIPVFVVRGNSDTDRLERWAAKSRNARSLHLKTVPLDGFELVGVSGTLPIPFNSRAGWHEARVLQSVAAMTHARSILVAHPPPYGCCDAVLRRFPAGSRGLARLIRQSSPVVMICGHIHEAAGVCSLGDTLVVNCALGANCHGALIYLEENLPPSAELI